MYMYLYFYIQLFQGFPKSVSKILDHLFLSSESFATGDNDRLHQYGITHVINCAQGYIHTDQGFYGKIKFLGFHGEDDEDYDIMQHFDDVYNFIEDARRSGGKALIHCIMGINRSGALCTAYCMVYKNLGVISAAMLVKKQRKTILTNENFQRQLVTFARKRGLLTLDDSML